MGYDLLLRNATIVDGTGAPRCSGDLEIEDGRIVDIGKLSGAANRVLDLGGLVAAPGVVDVHTHYDAQVCWDSVLSSSAEHGVTTAIMGNCGIGVAPCRPEHRDIALHDLVVLEGMSFDVMRAGIDWQFQSYPEYLDFLRRRGLGINIGPLVPLSTLRRYTMGEEARERAATPEEREEIADHLRRAMEAGALGFSSTMVRRQVGYQGKPLPCTLADMDELRAYAHVLRDLGRGAIQANVMESLANLKDHEYEILDMLLRESGRSVTFSGALYRNDDPEAVERMLQKAEPLRQRGAIPQTTIRPITIEVDFRNPFVFADVAAFKKVLNRPVDEQKRIYADPEWRAEALGELKQGGKLFGAAWENSVVLRIKDEKMRPLLFKSVRDIASERGKDPFGTMLDVALEDDLELKFLGDLVNTNPDHLRRHIDDPRVLIGLADGGAHIDMLFEAGYPTYMLGHWVRREGAIGLERAVRRMTSEPADYFGLHDRGRLVAGKAADIIVFDPDTVDSPEKAEEVRHDLPGGGARLYAGATGMAYVIVNGQVLYDYGAHTGALPGRIVNGR